MGRDPEAKKVALEKRSSIPVCGVCNIRTRGNNHSRCKKKKVKVVEEQKVEMANLIEMRTPSIPRKRYSDTKVKRKSQKQQKKRRKSGFVVEKQCYEKRVMLL